MCLNVAILVVLDNSLVSINPLSLEKWGSVGGTKSSHETFDPQQPLTSSQDSPMLPSIFLSEMFSMSKTRYAIGRVRRSGLLGTIGEKAWREIFSGSSLT